LANGLLHTHHSDCRTAGDTLLTPMSDNRKAETDRQRLLVGRFPPGTTPFGAKSTQ
jgi:hypothetical protein